MWDFEKERIREGEERDEVKRREEERNLKKSCGLCGTTMLLHVSPMAALVLRWLCSPL